MGQLRTFNLVNGEYDDTNVKDPNEWLWADVDGVFMPMKRIELLKGKIKLIDYWFTGLVLLITLVTILIYLIETL